MQSESFQVSVDIRGDDMSAQEVSRHNEGIFSHVLNSGIGGGLIFRDEEDYSIFLSFLNDYLTSRNSEKPKKSFSIRGKEYRGVPHLPKNYADDVELIAYSLQPNHFHLILHQLNKSGVEKLMRSLTTRYSIYFNKKYKRSGSLFSGPYKLANLSNKNEIILTTRHLHLHTSYTSLPEYLGEQVTEWVKPFFGDNRAERYKDYIKSYKVSDDEEKILENLIIEKGVQIDNTLERGTLERSVLTSTPDKKRPLVFEYSIITIVFIILLGLGIKNIKGIEAAMPKQSVLSESVVATPESSPTPSPTPADYLTVKIKDGSMVVNIRKSPSITSEKVGEATEGQTFESVNSSSPSWLGVKLPDGSVGYIYKEYAVLVN